MKKISIRVQIVVAALLIIAMMGLGFYRFVATQQAPLNKIVMHEMDLQSKAYVAQISQDVYRLCANNMTQLQANLDRAAQMVGQLIKAQGGISLGKQPVSWKLDASAAGQGSAVQLMPMLLGEQWFGQSADPAQPMILVDQADQLAGVKLTVFQRLNAAEDMLSVASAVVNAKGQRDIGRVLRRADADFLGKIFAGKSLSRASGCKSSGFLRAIHRFMTARTSSSACCVWRCRTRGSGRCARRSWTSRSASRATFLW